MFNKDGFTIPAARVKPRLHTDSNTTETKCSFISRLSRDQ